MMILPGGIVKHGEVQRRFGFREVDGNLELELASSVSAMPDVPSRVTAALRAALATLGAGEPDAALVDALCVGDRQYLMTRLAAHVGCGNVWLSAYCGHCGTRFDFSLDFGALPVKPAAPGYPFAEVELIDCTVQLRVPTGADQRAVAKFPDEESARQELARRCIVGGSGELDVTADTIERIEEALEDVAPEVATSVSARCPECCGVNTVDIDPYYCLTRMGNDILLDVHELAAFYHWSEDQILNLPRWRRKKYLQMVDRARGLAT